MSPAEPELRASDAERERVVEALRHHATAGRLDADELEERLGAAYAARTRGDLIPITADLPALRREAPPTAPRARRRLPDVSPLIAVSIMLIAIWALSGMGYFWPIWPIGAMALGAFKHRGAHSGCRGPARLTR